VLIFLAPSFEVVPNLIRELWVYRNILLYCQYYYLDIPVNKFDGEKVVSSEAVAAFAALYCRAVTFANAVVRDSVLPN
jgi:hypothetical protein